MFAKNQTEGGFGDAETIIGASVKVEGNFVCQGNMVIDGEVKGTVKTDKFLAVGQSSTIMADVEAGNARIAGSVQGNLIVSGFLELMETAKIEGDITVGSLSVARGAIMNGLCHMSKDFKDTTEVAE